MKNQTACRQSWEGITSWQSERLILSGKTPKDGNYSQVWNYSTRTCEESQSGDHQRLSQPPAVIKIFCNSCFIPPACELPDRSLSVTFMAKLFRLVLFLKQNPEGSRTWAQESWKDISLVGSVFSVPINTLFSTRFLVLSPVLFWKFICWCSLSPVFVFPVPLDYHCFHLCPVLTCPPSHLVTCLYCSSPVGP